MSEIFKGGDSNDNVIILLHVYLTDQHVFFLYYVLSIQMLIRQEKLQQFYYSLRYWQW